jgi:hypothetical protein
MKIEYVEISLTTVLDDFQKGFKAMSGQRISSFGNPLIDTAQGKVMFQLYLEDDEEWDRRYHQNEALCSTKRPKRK